MTFIHRNTHDLSSSGSTSSGLTSSGRPRRSFASRLRLALLALLCGTALSLAATSAASAVVVTGHAVGYESPDGLWIGSYALADGGRGFCVNLGRSAPTGTDFDPVDASTLGWYSEDDLARLAYISRTWASSDDPDTAASAQLATWMLTGTEGHSAADLAARAGTHAAHVLDGANGMILQANRPSGASHSVGAYLDFERAADGTHTVRADLTVNYLAGSEALAPGKHTGTITLNGALFADGTATKTVSNGVNYPVRPTSDHAIASMAATATFTSLPYGDAVTIGYNAGNVQNVLLATAPNGTATMRAFFEVPNLLPFQPQVVTQTSEQTAVPGAEISDHLTVSVAPSSNTSGDATGDRASDHWAVYGPDGGPYTPVPVVVRSTLLGPFDAAPEQADAAPEGAPVVCTVSTLVEHGPGDYDTEPCTLPAAGHYVWVESIAPADTTAEKGGATVLGWQSPFGVSSEVTTVPIPVVPVQPGAEAPVTRLAETGSSLEPQTAGMAAGGVLLGALLIGFGPARALVRAARTRIRHSVKL